VVISPTHAGLNSDRFGSFDPKERQHYGEAYGKGQFAEIIKRKNDGWVKKNSASVIWYGNCLSNAGEV